MRYFFSALAVVAGVFAGSFLFATTASAGGTLELKCDGSVIEKTIKNIYPPCNNTQFAIAYPGDIVIVHGYGFTVSTKQSPVNIDQSAVLVSGDRRIPIPRIYPLPPATASYMTQNGEFKGNIVVPRETPAGTYELSFKVTQRSCNYSKGVPCIVDIASATLKVLPTAQGKELELLCEKGETGGASLASCQRGSTFWFRTWPLPTQNYQSLFLYLRKNGVYKNYAYLQSRLDHGASTTGGINGEPGNYEVVLRSVIAGVRMSPTDWEKVGPTIKVVAPVRTPSPQPSPPVQPVIPVQEDPIQISGWLDADFLQQQEYLSPHVPRKYENAFFGGAHFSQGVIWTKGAKFPSAHQVRVSIGIGSGGAFKEKAYLLLGNIGAYENGIPLKRSNSGAQYYVLPLTIPYLVDGKPLPDGNYTIRLENNEAKSSPQYYDLEGAIVIEQIKPLKPKIIVPAQLKQKVQFEIKGMHFPSGSKITSVRFSADTDPISLPQSLTVKKDGTFSLKVTTPARADALIKYVIDDKDKTIDDFLWTPSATGKISVGVTATDVQGKEFFTSEKTSIPLLCDLSLSPSIAFTSPPIIDQTGPYTISFDAQGFTCRDKLTIQFEGIKTGGRLIDKKKSGNFFTSMPSPVTDYRGEVKQLGFGSGWGAREDIDSDVEYIRMVITDRKNRTVAANIKVISKYFISLKSTDTLIWRGFQGGVQAVLTLENKELLGKENPIILKRPYVDLNEKDSEGNAIIDFNTPSDIPAGIYTLRLTQDNHFAMTVYIIAKKGNGSLPPKKNIPPKEDALLNPCKGLEGYLLRTCRNAYGLGEEKKEDDQKKDEGVLQNPCSGLEGYMLRQCQKANNLQPPDEGKKQEVPKTSTQCSGLEGYMLRQCQEAYGIKQDTEKTAPPSDDSSGKKQESLIISYCDPELPKVWQKDCISRVGDDAKGDKDIIFIQPPDTKKQVEDTNGTVFSDPCASMEKGTYMYNQCRQLYPISETPKDRYEVVPSAPSIIPIQPKQEVKYCNPDLPKVWQEGCVQRPAESVAPTQKTICNPNVPSYSQPDCVPAESNVQKSSMAPAQNGQKLSQLAADVENILRMQDNIK
ncbi:MAG: hypothetical protein AAB400_01595 [Patescibacteria group bacterium]